MDNRPWLASYPEGVPHEVDVAQYTSLTQMLEECFRQNAQRPFSVCLERWMTYRELDAHSRALGAALQARGLAPGARVAIMLPNVPQFAVTVAAVLRAGYTCVNVNPLYTARELEYQLSDSGATAIVILENFCHTLEQVIARWPASARNRYRDQGRRRPPLCLRRRGRDLHPWSQCDSGLLREAGVKREGVHGGRLPAH